MSLANWSILLSKLQAKERLCFKRRGWCFQGLQSKAVLWPSYMLPSQPTFVLKSMHDFEKQVGFALPRVKLVPK